jgi:hypothetical protein
VEALREARARLAPGGVLSLTFAVISPELGRKIYLMMQQAFDGRPPVTIDAQYETAVIFAQSKEGDLRLDPGLLTSTGFAERSAFFADPAIRTDVSPTTGPLLRQRVYPAPICGGGAGAALSLCSATVIGGAPGRRPAVLPRRGSAGGDRGSPSWALRQSGR